MKCKHNTVEDQDNEPTTSDQVRSADGDEKMQHEVSPNQTANKAIDATDDTTACEQKSPRKTKAKKKAAPAQARAPPERISTRNRKAPDRFETLQEQATPKTATTRKGSSKVFDPVYITTNSTSRLGKADMYHMLTDDDTAWSSLSPEQQTRLVSMLPESAETQRLLTKIQAGDTQDTRPQYLKASDVFRTEVAKFQADLTNGHLAKTWRAAAEQAVAERAAGEYDAWKAEEAEMWWGQKGR